MFVDLATISRRGVEDQIDFFSLYDILFQKQLKKKKKKKSKINTS